MCSPTLRFCSESGPRILFVVTGKPNPKHRPSTPCRRKAPCRCPTPTLEKWSSHTLRTPGRARRSFQTVSVSVRSGAVLPSMQSKTGWPSDAPSISQSARPGAAAVLPSSGGRPSLRATWKSLAASSLCLSPLARCAQITLKGHPSESRKSSTRTAPHWRLASSSGRAMKLIAVARSFSDLQKTAHPSSSAPTAPRLVASLRQVEGYFGAKATPPTWRCSR